MSTSTPNRIKFHLDETSLCTYDVYTAASLGDIAYFMKYDAGKNDLDVPNSSGWTPLMYACARGHSLLVNYLLVLGAKRNCKSKSGITPLMVAITSGDLATVETIFHESALEETDYRQWSPLFYALHFTREKCLSFLLKRGANVNVKDYKNETPLMAAIKSGRESMVDMILQTAENLDEVSFGRETALMLANTTNNEVIKSMVEKRYESLERKNGNGETGTPTETEVAEQGPPKARSVIRPEMTSSVLARHIKNCIRSGKSLAYSPNGASKCSSPAPSSPWKAFMAKKFWSPQLRPRGDVKQFLKRLGLEKYWPVFRDEEVDFETLLTFNEDNLKDLGIENFGPRKKILLAIQKCREPESKKCFY